MRRLIAGAILALATAACSAPEDDGGTRPAGASVDASAPATRDATPPPAADGAQPAPPVATSAADAAAPASFDGATIPARFHGVYASRGACDRADESRLAITADAIRFHESLGRVLRARGEGDALEARLAMQGEGEAWERDVRFRLEQDGARLVDADGGMVRLRCPRGAG